ncbi:ribbon-helix-helix protein, CopG family [Candidatus Pacearchaeota archaeon]|nr:ribbon-helix-helix protein, CopG family [Candidatus Pacearchaeota archaeon]
MKVRVSATIDKETEDIIEFLMKTGKFRNKSHVIEDAIKLLKEQEHKK